MGKETRTVVFDARSAKIGGALNFTQQLPPRLLERLAPRGFDLRVLAGPPAGALERLGRRRALTSADAILHSGNRATFSPGARQVVCVRDRLLLPDTGERRPTTLRSRMRRGLLGHAVMTADALVVPSDSMVQPVQRLQERLGLRKPAPVHVIPHGRPAWTAPATRPFNDTVRLLYTSHFEWHKNFGLLAQVLKLGSSAFSRPVHLTLTTFEDDPISDGLLRRAFADVRQMVSFNGPIKQEQLQETYETHDILVFPSLVESFGLPLLEAMTTGMPIVASDRSWAREVCGGAASYVNPHSPDGWVTALTLILQLKKRTNTLGIERARAFDWGKAADQYIELLLDGVAD